MHMQQQPLIGIIGGKGRMGKAFTRFFREKGLSVIISDRDTETTNLELAQRADIVIISVPIAHTESVIREISPHVRKEALLIDLTSIKEMPLQTMLECSKSAVLGCHPMFGPQNLKKGQTVVLCKGRGSKWQERIEELFADFQLVHMSAEEHDQAMALIQGVEHFMKVCFAKTIADGGLPLKTLQKVESPIYKMQMLLTGRILAQDEKLYSQITYATEKSKAAIQSFVRTAQQLMEKGEEVFEETFLEGRDYFGPFCKKALQRSDILISNFIAEEGLMREDEVAEHRALGLLGPELTWSHIAAERSQEGKTKHLFKTFSAIFSALEEDKIDAAFVPLENSVSGSIREVYRNIWRKGYWIEEAFDIPITHCLASVHRQKPKIIFGHAAALAQCDNFLEAQYPNAQLIAVDSSSKAVLEAQVRDHSAAICAEEAAKKHHLSILHQDIQTARNNTTRFGLVVKKAPQRIEGKITALLFELPNEKGALLKILSLFSQAKKNLIKIESIPRGKKMSEYAFIIEMEGMMDADLQQALKSSVSDLRVLGVYSLG